MRSDKVKTEQDKLDEIEAQLRAASVESRAKSIVYAENNEPKPDRMNLHLKPLSELMAMSYWDRLQALFEWEWQYSHAPLDRYPFLSTQTPEARVELVKVKRQIITTTWAKEIEEQRTNVDVQPFVKQLLENLETALVNNLNLTLDEVLVDKFTNRFPDSAPTKNERIFELVHFGTGIPKAFIYELLKYENSSPGYLKSDISTKSQGKSGQTKKTSWLGLTPKACQVLSALYSLNKASNVDEICAEIESQTNLKPNKGTVRTESNKMYQQGLTDKFEKTGRGQKTKWKLTDDARNQFQIQKNSKV